LLRNHGIPITSMSRGAGLDTRLIKELRAFIKSNQIDVLHCHQYTPYIYGILASFGTKARVIFTEHGRFYPDSYKWKRFVVNPLLSIFTDAITAISQATANALNRFENFPKSKVQVVYNGIKYHGNTEISAAEKTHLREQLDVAPDSFLFGTISRLDPIKNHTMMLRAFADVVKERNEAQMVIIGDGPERDTLEKLVLELGIQASVVFTGFIVEPQKFIAAFDTFLLPSLSEGTSMTLLESMSYRCPSIVTNVGGNPEIVVNEETGIVIENEDEQALSASMLRLMADKTLRAKFGDAAFDRYFAKFSEANMVSSYEHLYEKSK